MKITGLNIINTDNRVRVSANIIWEDCGRARQELFFETEPAFSESIHPDPHAFLIASIIPALHFGEKRVYIDEEICPLLKDGLNSAMNLLRDRLYPPHRKNVAIQARRINAVPVDGEPRRAAFCFSGGVDSLSTLYHNRLAYSKGHPGYLQDGLLVFGMEVQDLEKFSKVRRIIAAIAEAADLTFVPVHTNIIEIAAENQNDAFWDGFWLYQYEGAAFAAIAHAFSKRWHSFSINGDFDFTHKISIYGTDPFIISRFSRWGLQIREEGHNFTRFEKTRMIADWDVAMQNLRVCNKSEHYEDGLLNCGSCEKCIRTMLALEATGALRKSTVFPANNVTVEMVERAVNHLTVNHIPMYEQLFEPLTAAGRTDLVRVLKQKIAESRKEKVKAKFKKRILELDQRYLNGVLKKLKAIGYRSPNNHGNNCARAKNHA